jgi:hypothetical protein
MLTPMFTRPSPFFPRSQHRREGLLSGAKLTCEWAQDLAGALGVK